MKLSVLCDIVPNDVGSVMRLVPRKVDVSSEGSPDLYGRFDYSVCRQDFGLLCLLFFPSLYVWTQLTEKFPYFFPVLYDLVTLTICPLSSLCVVFGSSNFV